jgi:steroid delta-isomerase-like uncharacterized protein
MHRYFEEILSQGNEATIEEIIHPNFAFRIPTLPEPVRGLEGLKGFVKGLRTAFPDIQFTVHKEMGEGDKVAGRWTIDATHLGPFLGAPPSGNHVHDQGVDIFRIADGKIIDIWVNENDLGLMQQMGVIPGGPA